MTEPSEPVYVAFIKFNYYVYKLGYFKSQIRKSKERGSYKSNACPLEPCRPYQRNELPALNSNIAVIYVVPPVYTELCVLSDDEVLIIWVLCYELSKDIHAEGVLILPSSDAALASVDRPIVHVVNFYPSCVYESLGKVHLSIRVDICYLVLCALESVQIEEPVDLYAIVWD